MEQNPQDTGIRLAALKALQQATEQIATPPDRSGEQPLYERVLNNGANVTRVEPSTPISDPEAAKQFDAKHPADTVQERIAQLQQSLRQNSNS